MSRTTQATSQSNPAARMATARPYWVTVSSPAKYDQTATKYTTSASCQIVTSRQRGRASTARGSSHSAYCGDHTLLTSRNAATAKNASCASRGGSGAVSASSTMATSRTPAAPRARRTTEPGSATSFSSNANQIDPKSAGRSALNLKNACQ